MPTPTKPAPITWAFRSRFRRGAFGWSASRLAMERIDEAMAEIKAVARHDPATAADGAVLLLEKLSPALSQVDSSSGALGNAAFSAVQTLVPLIAQAPVETSVRGKWLERLFDAIQEDDPPYIESLGDRWGELCASTELSSAWAERLLPTLQSVLGARKKGTYAFFPGTSLCYSALFAAGRHDELMQLLDQDPHPIWPYLVWGGRVLAARGQVDEAIAYVRDKATGNVTEATIARFAEEQLLKVGRRAEAFEQYAMLANEANSHLATFRAIAKKYPELSPEKLLGHLVASTPAMPGKWFATAKTLKQFDLAMRLAWASPCEPKTLTRAARDHLARQPEFAMQCALAALHWATHGHGYELSPLDVIDAHQLAREAAAATGQLAHVDTTIRDMLAANRPAAAWARQALGSRVAP